jgi:16S rRNA (adenine1518-N6/adenine1519-N6)-dimethyltransferase
LADPPRGPPFSTPAPPPSPEPRAPRPAAGFPPLRDIIARHGLAARHSLGQHFLLDGNLTDRIVREAGDLAGRHIIEVGPGPGGLTRSLLRSAAASITAIELDRRAIGAITELAQLAGDRLQVIEGDALSVRRCWSAGCATPRPSSG